MVKVKPGLFIVLILCACFLGKIKNISSSLLNASSALNKAQIHRLLAVACRVITMTWDVSYCLHVPTSSELCQWIQSVIFIAHLVIAQD